MPELPEVETIRRSLAPQLIGRTIEAVDILHPDVLINSRRLPLAGWRIDGLRRRGKYLLVDAGRPDFAAGLTIVIHLRMTGQLLLDETDTRTLSHLHVRFRFQDRILYYRDVRRFGRIWYLPGGLETDLAGLAALGPEPLSEDWTAKDLRQALARHPKAAIKAALLDQRVVAGLGNIYVDEALFRARISPIRPAASLTTAETKALHASIQSVLQSAIGHRGTTLRDYVDGFNTRGHFQYELKVYGRGGQPCAVCGRTLLKRRVAGRGTCSCPACQPDGSFSIPV